MKSYKPLWIALALMVERLFGVLGTVGHHLISHAPSHSTASLSLASAMDSGCHGSFQDIRNRASIPNEFASGWRPTSGLGTPGICLVVRMTRYAERKASRLRIGMRLRKGGKEQQLHLS